MAIVEFAMCELFTSGWFVSIMMLSFMLMIVIDLEMITLYSYKYKIYHIFIFQRCTYLNWCPRLFWLYLQIGKIKSIGDGCVVHVGSASQSETCVLVHLDTEQNFNNIPTSPALWAICWYHARIIHWSALPAWIIQKLNTANDKNPRFSRNIQTKAVEGHRLGPCKFEIKLWNMAVKIRSNIRQFTKS